MFEGDVAFCQRTVGAACRDRIYKQISGGALRIVAASRSYNAVMPRFFCETPIAENSRISVDARVAQHVRVLRLREGEAITLFDGSGGEVPATIAEIGKRDVVIETRSRIAVERELSRSITLHVGLIANDRFDWLIQKATELGVAAIQPLYSERSQRIPGDVEKRVAHWRGVAIAACEQCGRNRIPNLMAPISLDSALAKKLAAYNVVMDAEGDSSLTLHSVNDSFNVFVGPEGGFSADELALLRDSCRYRFRIGGTILRAETAAIAAMVRVAM
jgi:16S rRNA (uracil1498-N3)-methyltransferase